MVSDHDKRKKKKINVTVKLIVMYIILENRIIKILFKFNYGCTRETCRIRTQIITSKLFI